MTRPSLPFGRTAAKVSAMTAAAMLAAGPTVGTAQTPPPIPPIVVSPNVPTDIPGGAPNADLGAAAAFAWNEFIALNWPAKSGTREAPDGALPFGYMATAGGPPLVWQTMRHKIEIFPPRTSANATSPFPAPHGAEQGPPFYGYDDPPAYYYQPADVGTNNGSVLACPGHAATAQAPWVNLDETSQIGLDNMYAGIVPNTPAVHGNSQPQLIRFMAKANHVEYDYVMQKGYWYHSAALDQAEQNYKDAVARKSALKEPYVSFPDGTIEVKSAWRQLSSSEAPERFHTTTVRFYQTTGTPAVPCYVDATWALIGLHIIHKTPSAPAFVFATFEQADNILTTDGKPTEDNNGVANPPSGASTEPPLTYADSPINDPTVATVPANTYCTTAGTLGEHRLYYHEISGNTNLPTGGNICVNRRDHAIPAPIVAANILAHQAIKEYQSAQKTNNSPWMYYKLVNVQAYPFDKTQIDSAHPDSKFGPASFFQANSVIETDFTLQNFSGRLTAGGAPSDYPVGQTGSEFKNLHLFLQTPGAAHGFNMGGCQGCHANAQLGGTDFSFILDGNTFQPSPDTTAPVTQSLQAQLSGSAAQTQAESKRYRDRFLSVQ